MLPRPPLAHSPADFRSRDKANVLWNFQGVDAMAKIGRRLETAVPRSNQQLETADHVAKRTRCAVIPIHDALGGIATTQEEQANGISVGLAAFRRDFREKASGTGGDGKTRFRLRGCEQHLDALFEGDRKSVV